MNRNPCSILILTILGGSLLLSCDASNKIEIVESEPKIVKEEESQHAVIGKNRVRWERIPTKDKSQGRRSLKWRLIPGDDNLILSVGITGSKDHGGISMKTEPEIHGDAPTSGVLLSYDEETISGEMVLSMVGVLGGKEVKEKLEITHPIIQAGELRTCRLQVSHQSDFGGRYTSISGVIPGSARPAKAGFTTSSEKSGAGHFAVDQVFVLARNTTIPTDKSFTTTVSENPLDLVIDGESISLEEYEHPAWALWVKIAKK